MKKIGCFAHTIDPLFLDKKFKKNLVVFIPKHSKALQKRFHSYSTVLFNFKGIGNIEEQSDTDILMSKDLQSALQHTDITHFLISHRSSKKLFATLRTLKLTPIGNDYRWSTKLENKIYFDSILNKLKIQKPKTLNKVLLKTIERKVVLQEADSFGSFGTKIIPAKKVLQILEKKNKTSLIVREFIEGSVFGITMLVQDNAYALSALRQQCYYDKDLVFAGVQWISHKDVSKKVQNSLTATCKKLFAFCKKKKIVGTLNFDFIVTKSQDVFLLECNPRPSSATPQLLSHPNLIHGIDLSSFILDSNFRLPHKPFIPPSTFKGALLDLMVVKHAKRKRPQSNQQKGLFMHTVSKPEYKNDAFLGMILSDKPLFSKAGLLLNGTKKLYESTTGISLF